MPFLWVLPTPENERVARVALQDKASTHRQIAVGLDVLGTAGSAPGGLVDACVAWERQQRVSSA